MNLAIWGEIEMFICSTAIWKISCCYYRPLVGRLSPDCQLLTTAAQACKAQGTAALGRQHRVDNRRAQRFLWANPGTDSQIPANCAGNWCQSRVCSTLC